MGGLKKITRVTNLVKTGRNGTTIRPITKSKLSKRAGKKTKKKK